MTSRQAASQAAQCDSVIYNSCGWRSRNQYPFTSPPIFLSLNTRRSTGQTGLPLKLRKDVLLKCRSINVGHSVSAHRPTLLTTPLNSMCTCRTSCSSHITQTSEVESAGNSPDFDLDSDTWALQKSIHSSTLWARLCSARLSTQWSGFVNCQCPSQGRFVLSVV